MKKILSMKTKKRCYNCGKTFYEDENKTISAYCLKCRKTNEKNIN